MASLDLSIGIANYNHAHFLPFALEAILSQSVQPSEIVIIDDASTDNSLEVINKYAERNRVIRLVVNRINRGVLANAATLLEIANGRYYYGAASDDIILPGFLEKSLLQLERYPSAGLCSTLSTVIDADGVDQGLLFSDPFRGKKVAYYLAPDEVRRQLIKRPAWFQGNTTIYRRDALVAVGGYRPELGSYCDGFAQLAIGATYGVCFISEPLAAWRRMPNTYSAQTNMNPATVLKIRDMALDCMNGEYRHIFSPTYVSRWKRRSESSWLIGYSYAKSREWRHGLRELLTKGSLANRLLLGVGEAAIVTALALTVIGAVALRWFDLGQIAFNRFALLRQRHLDRRKNPVCTGQS